MVQAGEDCSSAFSSPSSIESAEGVTGAGPASVGRFGPLGLGMDGLSLSGEEAGPRKEGAVGMGMGQPKHARSPNPACGYARIWLGSSNSKMVGPSKRPGRKHRALAKELWPLVIKDLTLIGSGYQGTFIFTVGGLGEVVTAPCHEASREIGA